MTTGKTIALTRWIFVGKVMSLLFNMLSRLVITFLPRSKRLLISWLQSPSAVILEPPKVKSVTVSTVSPSICHEVMGPGATILVFWMLSFKPTFSLSSLNFIKRLLGAIPHWRSGRAAVRRYPSPKVRSNGCALLKQPWRDTHAQGKRNPTKTGGVARGHQRANTLKPYSQKTSQSNPLGPQPCLTQWN